METFREVCCHLLPKRGPHLQSDHPQVQEQHCRLAGGMGSVSLLSRQNHSEDQSDTHGELCHQVDIGCERGTGTKESVDGK